MDTRALTPTQERLLAQLRRDPEPLVFDAEFVGDLIARARAGLTALSAHAGGEQIYVSKSMLTSVLGCEVQHLAPSDFAWSPSTARGFVVAQGDRAARQLARGGDTGAARRRGDRPARRRADAARRLHRRAVGRRSRRAPQLRRRAGHQLPPRLPPARPPRPSDPRGVVSSGSRPVASTSAARRTSSSDDRTVAPARA